VCEKKRTEDKRARSKPELGTVRVRLMREDSDDGRKGAQQCEPIQPATRLLLFLGCCASLLQISHSFFLSIYIYIILPSTQSLLKVLLHYSGGDLLHAGFSLSLPLPPQFLFFSFSAALSAFVRMMTRHWKSLCFLRT
jgi:hypothetical protein